MATKKKGTALALASTEDLLPDDVDFDELKENLSEMDEIEFPRVRFRQGKFFFSDDPDDKGVDEFEGVLYFWGRQNTYWEGAYDPNNPGPPKCFSVDGKVGSEPRNSKGQFGNCSTCKLNEFGSGTGKGKACRNQVKLYFQVLGTTVPMTLFLAPTSIGGFTKTFIMNKVTQKGLSYSKIITKFKSYQKNNESYYRINFEVEGIFKGDEAKQVKGLRDFWLKAIKLDRARLDESVSGSSSDDDDDMHDTGSEQTDTAPEETTGRTRKVGPRKPEPAPVSAPEETSSFDDDDDDDPPF